MQDLDKVKEYLKRVQSGEIEVDDLINKSDDYMNNTKDVMDLSERALADKFLEQTGLPIPQKGMSSSKQEQMLGDIFKQMYPNTKTPDIQVHKTLNNAQGLYYPDSKIVKLSRDTDDLNLVGKGLHEFGHHADIDANPNFKIPDILSLTSDKKKAIKELGAKTGKDLLKLDSQIPSEIMQLGHHVTPDNKSYALSKLTNFFKNKKFAQALPIVGTAMGVGSALMSGDVSAAVPVAQDIESLGPKSGSPEATIENPKATNEQRQKALEQIRKRALDMKLGE